MTKDSWPLSPELGCNDEHKRNDVQYQETMETMHSRQRNSEASHVTPATESLDPFVRHYYNCSYYCTGAES